MLPAPYWMQTVDYVDQGFTVEIYMPLRLLEDELWIRCDFWGLGLGIHGDIMVKEGVFEASPPRGSTPTSKMPTRTRPRTRSITSAAPCTTPRARAVPRALGSRLRIVDHLRNERVKRSAGH